MVVTPRIALQQAATVLRALLIGPIAMLSSLKRKWRPEGGDGESELEPPAKRPRIDGGSDSERGNQPFRGLFCTPLVMARVARWMPARDLLRLRSTTRIWQDVMLPQLRKKHTPILYPLGLGRRSSFPQALACPFAKFNIHTSGGMLLGNVNGRERQPPFNASYFRSQFACWSQHLTSLELYISTASHCRRLTGWACVAGLRRLFFNDAPVLRSLKLTSALSDIDLEGVGEGGDDDNWVWQELPHLEAFELNNRCTARFMDQLERDVLRATTGLRTLSALDRDSTLLALETLGQNAAGALASVRELNLFGSIKSESLAQLSTLTSSGLLRLHALRVGVLVMDNYDVGNEKLTRILEAQAPQLRALTLQVRTLGFIEQTDPPPPHVRLPPMLELEQLTLTALHNPEAVQFVGGDGAYASLQRVSLSNIYESWSTALSQAPIVEITFQQVSAWEGTPELFDSPLKIEALAANFPHIRRARLGVIQSCVPHLWRAWPAMQDLHLTVYEVDPEDEVPEEDEDDGIGYMDPILTGIDPSSCRRLRDSAQRGVVDFEEACRCKQAPGLTDAPLLQNFTLEFRVVAAGSGRRYGWGDGAVTDVTGYYALGAPDSKLQQICIVPASISETCAAAVRERLGQGALISFK